MADDSVVVDHHDDKSKIVSQFLLNTSRLLQPTIHHVWAISVCAAVATKHPSRDDEMHDTACNEETDFIPLITGSSAEFYIQPMLSCVGDVDIMYQYCNRLAIPDGFPPPTELPAGFHSRVEVFEIVECESEVPGYVLLHRSYLLTEDSDTGKYNAMQSEPGYWAYCERGYLNAREEIHGPAVTRRATPTESELSVDQVPCVRCLWWPSQAADWPTRHRNYDWPDSATVDLVVSDGCHVVNVAHHQCRDDEFMRDNQWRLSFSRAEIVLLNRCMPVQQILYHLLRVFNKTVRLTDITDDTGTKIFSNYYLKTLILWTCELKPQSWWTDDMNVVRICFKLLHMLADWLNNKICPHYFVNNCNLLYQTSPSEIIASQLALITESWLSTWFVNNYLRKCAQLCPDTLSRLFFDVSTRRKLQNAVSAVVHWRLNSALSDLWRVYNNNEFYVSGVVSRCSLTLLTCGHYINKLVKINSYLCDYFTAVAFLHIANRIAKHSLNDELLDVLATVLGQFVGKRRYCHQLSSELSLSQAVILMKVVANDSRSTVQQIEFELSKAYLHRALRCKDSDSDSTYCLANVYLAVLYYTSGQYQTAIDHCALVTRSRDHSQCSSHVVQGVLLPKIDDNIDAVLGLAVFYQYIRTAALNQQQTQYVVAFTTELFAHYLYIMSVIKCRHFTQTELVNERHRRTKDVVDSDQLFIADVLLQKPIKMLWKLMFHYKPQSEPDHKLTVNAAGHMDTSELVELLQQSAVEHFTTYRQLEAQQFVHVATFVTTDFEALYAYKRGNYERCLQLSTQNVRTLLYSGKLVPFVSTHSDFLQLMDDDIVSLSALHLIVNPKCRETIFYTCISQLTLLLYLMTQCQLKLRHSVTSLAQTLDYIEFAHSRCARHPIHAIYGTLENLTLKLTERKLIIHLSKIMH